MRRNSLSSITAVLLTCVVGVTAIGCDRDSERVVAEPESADLPDRVTFQVDGEGIFYVTYGASGKKHPANRLGDIPVAERSVVGVHISGTSPESLVGQRVYVANLLGANSGKDVNASLHSYERFRHRSRTASRAGEHAIRVTRTTRRVLGQDKAVQPGEIRPPGQEHSKDEEPHPTTRHNPTPDPSTSDEIVIRSMDALKARTNRPGGGVLIRPGHRTSPDNPSPSPEKPAAARQRGPRYRPVTLYGAEWCPACQKAKKWLEREEVSFEYRDIDKSRSAKESMVRFCRQKKVKPGSIPTLRIEVDGSSDRVMQGWSPQMFRRLALR